MSESVPPPNGIYWLASYPTSGNSWLRVFIQNLVCILRGEPVTGDHVNKTVKFSIVEALEENYRPFVGKADAGNWRKVAAARPKAQEAIVRRASSSIFVATHLAALDVAGVPLINGTVTRGATYVVRNPLDVVVTLAAELGISIDQAIEVMADPNHHTANGNGQVFEVWSSWSGHVESWTRDAHPALLVLRYEDLATKPREAFEAFVRHAGLRPTDTPFLDSIELSAFARLDEEELKWGFRDPADPSRTSPIGGWRERLTDAQAERVLSQHGPAMAKFGYTDA